MRKQGPLKYSIAADSEHLPKLTVSQQSVDEAHKELFGLENESRPVSIMALIDSDWAKLSDLYYFERIVHVLDKRTLLLRFLYDYEIDLDRVNSERDLLAWSYHLCSKNWMDTAKLREFIDAVCQIKKFRIHGL